MTDTAQGFNPDWVSPPGETIADLLEERDWSQVELAQRLGYTTKHLNQLVRGKVPLSEDAAMRLERVLGGSAGFWLAREAHFRERLARLESQKRLAEWTGWLDRLPVKELMQQGVIAKKRVDAGNKPGIVEELLRFFGVASPDEWDMRYAGMQACFRRSRPDQSDIGAISSWLRMGERASEQQEGPKYDPKRFNSALVEIRGLTQQPPVVFEPRLRALCRESGIAFVLVPAIPRAHVSGVARWLNPHRPVIQLSLYGKTNDRFWFTFFHEAAHVLLHGKEKKAVFLDDVGRGDPETAQEQEANEWASAFLIPEGYTPELPELKTKAQVHAFSDKIGIHPGIVVGRLQHEGIIPVTWMNDLKVSFRFNENHE